MKVRKREKTTSSTSGGDYSLKNLAEGHETSHRDGNNTLNRDNGVHLTPKGDNTSMHGPGTKGSCL